jgi:outer membrane protein assembly factor BamD
MMLRSRCRSLLFLALGLTFALTACSKDKDEYVERPVEQLYNSAVDLLSDGSYLRAAKQFDEVERQHPYSVWATKAQLMSAYGYYQANKYDEAIVALDRFIQLNPSNRDVAYAYYLKAICYYEQITDVQRDAKVTELALKGLQEVSQRFPDSIYGRDSRLKIDLTYDHLAGKEMEVGRFYLGRAQYLGALNRFKYVVDRYQTTSHVPEALHRMIECYLALGLKEEAQRTAAVLGYNYPGSDWYADSYSLVQTGKLSGQSAERPGFFRRALNTLPF